MKKLNHPFLWQSILLFAFTVPLSQFVSVRLLAVILIYSLFVKSEQRYTSVFKQSWDIIIYLLILALGLIYSMDLKAGLSVLETSFSFLAIPVIFNKVDFNKEKLHLFFINFVSGLVLACIICLVVALLNYYDTGESSVFFYTQFTQIIGYQPTYTTYYICFSLATGLYFLYYEKSQGKNFLLIGALIFLFAMGMLTAGRTAYISMLFVFSFFILKFLFEEDKAITKIITFGLAIFFLITMLFINYYNLTVHEGDYWERLSLWKSAIDANTSFVFGVGTGDYKQVMNDYYITHNLSQFATDSFNAHNQFLQSFFSNGFIGLLSIVILLARPLYLSVKYQNVLGILVFFSFLIYGMTEVFLGRYQGVVFFALLHQIFIHYYYSRQPAFSLKEV